MFRTLLSCATTALLVFVAGSPFVTAQSRFETGVDLVAMDICATDHHGKATTLGATDLIVFDDGVPQRIAVFLAGDHVPLAVTLLIDSSLSMYHGLLDRATAAAAALIRQLPADSLVEVMSFSEHAAVRYPMGPDHQQAERSLTELSPAGGTALYEALMLAIRGQQRAARTRTASYRQVIVLLTDGENNTGHVTFDDVADETRRSGMVVYTVTLPPHDAPASGPTWQMMQLASDTGGESIAARQSGDLVGIYEHIAEQVKTLYRVGFVPSSQSRDGTWHRLQVRAVQSGVVVRSRSGYYAPNP